MTQDSIKKIILDGAVRLGRGDSRRPPPLLMHFSHPSERNLVLSFSKNLKNNKISFEKHVPKIYQSEYKKFKDLSTKLRLMPDMNYQTQITFDSHLMLLRYKSRDTTTQKFHYVTHSEYYPPMSHAASELKSSLQIPSGTVSTPVISPDVVNRANCSFFMTGMSEERTEDTFKRQFMEFLGNEDKDSVTDCKLLKKSTAVIYCRTWEECKKIVVRLKDTKFQNEKVHFSMFSEVKPKNL